MPKTELTWIALCLLILALSLSRCAGGDTSPAPSTVGFGLALHKMQVSMDAKGSLTDKYIFSKKDDPSVEGEGFFVTLNGEAKMIFVACKFQDNPHDIENARRKFMAILRGVNSVTYMATVPLDVYLETKIDLNMENRFLSDSAYKARAEQVRADGHTREIELVYYKDVVFENETLRFPCANISATDPITGTTGGSVYVFAVHFSDMADDLNLGLGTVTPNGMGLLEDFKAKVDACKGSGQEIVATGLQFQEAIYTFAGTLSGWVANISTVTVE